MENLLLDSSELAVEANNISKSYRIGYNGRNVVIRGLSMAVKKGHIYGLLGASGSGKSTLFKCLVGHLKVDEGVVKLFGQRQLGNCTAGSLIGYMPQIPNEQHVPKTINSKYSCRGTIAKKRHCCYGDNRIVVLPWKLDLSLYDEMTIDETMFYYGFICGMNHEQIRQRMKSLASFLQLKPTNRVFENLSGGQKRRVSFAVALIHQPPLLILDEPTVGVDPLLRKKIWEHLRYLAESFQTTIIMSTHYIEEARCGDTVGMMSNGEILVEDNPETLMRKHNSSTLENVFYELCLKQHQQVQSKEQEGSQAIDVGVDPLKSTEQSHYQRFIPKKLLASSFKTASRYYRNPALLLFAALLPSLQLLLSIPAIGGEFFNLPLAFVNHDTGDLGEAFISSIDNRVFDKMNFDNFDTGLAELNKGNLMGLINIDRNFTENLMTRFSHGLLASDDVIAGSTINVSLDYFSEAL
ncbi:hypothetical protein CHUAL_006183 [Chamberlinius hualienensis]